MPLMPFLSLKLQCQTVIVLNIGIHYVPVTGIMRVNACARMYSSEVKLQLRL